LRLEPSTIHSSNGGAVTFVFDPVNSAEQADLAEKITASSLKLALAAASLRRRMGG
jgi:hypothetical protein